MLESGQKPQLEFFDEVVDVGGDLIRLLLVDEVSHSFHHDHLLQEGHTLLQATIVDVFLGAGSVISDVKVPDYELRRHFDL